jgi:hypothetical protein
MNIFESNPAECKLETRVSELELAIVALIAHWQRNFLRPRHRSVLRETSLAKWAHRERRKQNEARTQ